MSNSDSTPNQSFSGPYAYDLLDPRSPTTAFQRTPLQIIYQDQDSNMSVDENTCDLNVNDVNSVEVIAASPNSHSLNSELNDLEELKNTSNSSTSFLSATTEIEDANLDSCNPSPVVSDFNVSETSEKQPNTDNEVINVETPKTSESESEQVVLTNEKSHIEVTPENSFIDSSNEFKNPAKKLFYTPNKKRAPLVQVDNICPVSLPQNLLRQKQWKRIQEERKKLGLESDENVPLPLNDLTASAPSKLMLRKNRLQTRYNV